MAEDYPVNIVFDAVDKVTAPMRRINSRIERMTGPFRRMNNRLRALGRESGIARLRDSMSRVGSATGRVVRQIGSLGTKLALVGGLAGTVLARTVNRVAGTGDELAKSARSMGISAEFLQEYQFAAERVGVSQGVLNTSFVAFSKRLGEMKNGYGRLRTLLKETNPDLMEQLATTRSTEEAFGLLMGAMENIEDPAQRSALAAAAFSRQGVRLTNIATAGSEEISRLRQRAHELGLVMNEDALKASERYQDSLTNMQSAMKGLQRIVGAALIPVFADLMDRMTIFFVNNREQIRGWAEGFAASVPDHLRTMRDAAVSVLDALQPLISSFQWMFDTFGTGETILGTVALLMGGPLLAAVGSLAAAIVGLGAAIGFTPIGWFLAGIAAIATAIYGLNKALGWIKKEFPAAFEFIRDTIGVVIDSAQLLGDALTGNFDSLRERIERIGQTIQKWIPDWLREWLSGDDEKTITLRDERRRRSGESEEDANERSARNRPGAQGRLAGARGAVQSSTRTERRESRVQVDFQNLPRGARVEQEGDDEDVDLSTGRAMAMP